ncbi:MAG: LEA type 2 family protein [Alcanivoracaceae bacterium]|nr:LEA type 2 family protein [Alcanivoracaceae bacterium]
MTCFAKTTCVIAVVMLLTACTGIKRDTIPPEMSLSDVQLLGASLFEQQWQLTLRAHNPNAYPLKVRALDYEIFIEDKSFARGVSNEKIELPALGDTLVKTRVNTSLLEMISSFQTLNKANGEPVAYRIDGSALLGSMPVPLKFSYSGSTNLSDGKR